MIPSLIDHLWQSTVFVLAAGLVAVALRQNGAHIRHGVWLVASLKFLLPFSLLMSLGSTLPWTAAVSTEAPAFTDVEWSMTVDQVTQPFSSGTFASASAVSPSRNWLPGVVAAAWAFGFAAVIVMRVHGWRRVRSALRSSSPSPVQAPVPVRCAPGMLEPGVVGIWRPVLLVPKGLERELTPKQLEAVLLHELCHVRRRDNLTSAIHMLVEAVFWFHPFVWFIGARLMEERERACDEFVLKTSGDPAAYAESILNVCKLYVESPVACVAGVTGADLKRRVAAIMINRTGAQLNTVRKAALALAAILAIATPIAAGMATAPLRASTFAAQNQEAGVGKAGPRFDVVSVKPCEPGAPGQTRSSSGSGGSQITSPGRLYLQCYPLASMVTEAYLYFADGRAHTLSSVIDVGVEGGPDWMKSDRYTIEARTDQLPAPAMMRGPMLQAVLEDRFKLKVRRLSRELPVYDLVPTKSGAKVAPYTGNECVLRDPAAWPPAPPPDGQRYCGDRSRLDGDLFVREGVMTLDELASLMRFDLPVVNKTGITAPVSYKFAYPKEEALAGVNPPSSFVTALRNQLGLELRPSKGPRAFLIVEHAERPTPDFAQVQQRRFEVASIKPCEGAAPPSGQRGGGSGQQASPGYLFLSCLTLRQLVLQAHAGPDSRLLNRRWEEQFVEGFPPFVKGGPSWAYSDRFTIEARAAGISDRITLAGPMLRGLLEDRFKLKIRRVTEERTMLVMTVAKSGLRIQPTEAGSCVDRDPANPPPPGAMGDKAPCGLGAGNGWGSSQFFGVSFGASGRDGERFTDHLWRALRRPVIDRTGLVGRYSFSLEFTPDDTTPGVKGRCGGNPDCMNALASRGSSDERPASFKSGDNLFRALEKLGLKLEEARVPFEHIVIEHVERPTPDLALENQGERRTDRSERRRQP